MYTLDDVRSTYKPRDAWWTVLLVDPLASRLVLPIANRTRITPNQVTLLAFACGLAAAAAFLRGDHPALLLGAVLFHLSFVLDCVDGKLARLKGSGSMFGMWLDFSLDRYRVWVCALALMYGQFERTENAVFLWLAALVLFLDMLRYLNAFLAGRMRREMRRQLREARMSSASSYLVSDMSQARRVDRGGVRDRGNVYVPPATGAERAEWVEGAWSLPSSGGGPLSRLSWWASFRDPLMRYRVRPHLFSGIEYQMFIFIVGPALDAVLPVVLLSAGLLLAFESVLVYLLFLSSREVDRELRRLAPTATAEGPQRGATVLSTGTPAAPGGVAAR